MSDMLDKLAKNRVPILLAEIGAYLHLIGRFSEEFIYAQAKDATKEERKFVKKEKFRKVCNNPDYFENIGLDSLLRERNWERLVNAFKDISNSELLSNKVRNLCEFIEKHTWKKRGLEPRGLCRILADAHGIVSGIDKALAGGGEVGKQRKGYTFRATAFGYEKKIELLRTSDLNQVRRDWIRETKRKFFEELKGVLESVKLSQSVSYNDYKKFVELIKTYYSKTIGETRRPINEISLYNYAYTIASLVKSNLAKIVVDGWYEVRGNSKWRILKINLDVIGLLSKGLKVGDILGYREEIERVYDDVKKVIEFEYPLGNEIYRDSTGIYFSCPNFGEFDNPDNLNNLKSEIIDKLKALNRLDFSLQVEISMKSRSMVILASEREASLRKLPYLHFSADTEYLREEFMKSKSQDTDEDKDEGKKDICPVCRIRLKSEKKDRCERCGSRYLGRAKIWLEDPGETIWLDEVSDKNDRLALIVGQFDLRKWLSGEFVGTFASQTFDGWKGSLPQEIRNFLEDERRVHSIDDLRNYLRDLLGGEKDLQVEDLEVLNSFLHLPDELKVNGKLDVSKFDIDEHFWNPIAERDATGEALNLKDSSEKAKHLIKLLFRKHPSLARIYRIWETTQDFINESIFAKILNKHSWNLSPRRQRIQFKIDPKPYVPERSTCDIDVDGVRFSPVCIDSRDGIFVTTINLELLEKLGKSVEEIAGNLSGKNAKIKTEKDSTWKRRLFKIIEAKPADEKFQNYLPYVKIYDFPDQFMVLVPAYEAFDIVEKILEEYEIQFSKVRDRLPLHLGIIGFRRRTPLYVVMDAGRRLLEAFRRNLKTVSVQVISVRDVEDKNIGKCIELTVEDETKSFSSIPLRWRVSYSTGDPDQEDLWHPYIRFKSSVSDRNLCFDYTGSGNYVVHVREIREGDIVEIEPSYFKLSYLENPADRFRIDEGLIPLDHIHRLRKLWEEIESRLKKRIWSISQVYAYWSEVKKRREHYDEETFKKFVDASLVNILEIEPDRDKKLFTLFFEATVDGTFDLCLHWNFQVRKIKPGGGKGNEGV